MKYYKDSSGEVFALEIDGSQDGLIKSDWLPVDQPEQPEFKLTPKLIGVEFDGVMCSATKEDMWGLNSIKDWVAAGNNVEFEFDNGNVLTLTKDNYSAFEAVWIPFRAGFF